MTGSTKRSRLLRVLVAEDESIVRLDLCGLLEDQGMVVCGQARNGIEAVELARELEPDVALIDIGMPGLDGIEACRRINAERPIPIMILTGHSDRGLIERAIAAGAFTYLVKPFRETDVVPAVRAAAARHGELLAARRVVGSSTDSMEIGLPSPSGNLWPLRVHRLADGSVRFSGVAAREESTS
jgi:DNA-binding NarL/FixJ family response regulator